MTEEGLRTPWRVLLFISVFMLAFSLEAALLPALVALPMPEDRISAGLVAQTAMMLLAALFAAWVLLRWVDRRPVRGLGFPMAPTGARDLAAGTAIGAAALVVVVAVFAAAGAYRYVPEPGTLAGWIGAAAFGIAALIVPAAAEEALLRGYAFRALVEGPGPVAAVLLTSVVFAVLHAGNPGVGAFGYLNLFLAGVVLAVAVLRTGMLWLATGVHVGWNWVMAGPLDLPVSGLRGLGVPLYDAEVTGPGWLTGGAFGPEGGLVGTVGAGVALALVVRLTRDR